MWLDSEWKCQVLMVVGFILVMASMFGVMASLEQGYGMTKIADSADVEPINTSDQNPNNSVYYHNYSSLSDEQQGEFKRLQENGSMTNLTHLPNLGKLPLHIQYQGDKYIIEYGLLPSLDSKWMAVGSVVLLLIGVFSLIIGHERKVDIRLENMYENPLEFIDTE